MIGDDSLVGQQIGNYRLQKAIARGTYGSVYVGQHWLFRDELAVAIKLLNARLNNKKRQEQFIREASILRRLKHRSILPLIDAGVHQGIPYLVTLHAVGGSLRDLLERHPGQAMRLDRALWILLQLGEALEYAHSQHVVHRDLKPENILFGARGEVFLADFGLALVLESNQTNFVGSQGTPLYMAPEQFEGYVSPKSDQYAFACVAYEMIAGRRPFVPANPGWETIWFHHTRVAPPPPSRFNPHIPEQVEKALLRGLAKDRTARFNSIAEMVEALIPPQHLLTARSPQARLTNRATPRALNPPAAPSATRQPITPAPDQAAAQQPIAQAQQPTMGSAIQPAPLAPDQDISAQTTLRETPPPDQMPVQEPHEQSSAREPVPETQIPPAFKLPRWDNSRQATHDTPASLEEKSPVISPMRLRAQQAAPEHAHPQEPERTLPISPMRLRAQRAAQEAQETEKGAAVSQPGWHAQQDELEDEPEHRRSQELAVNALELLDLTSEEYRKQGHAFRDAGVYDRALAAYDRAIQLNPNNPLAYYGQAKIYWDMQRYTEAIQAYDAIVRLQPDDPFYQALRGNALYELQNYPAALAAYDAALHLKQDNASWHARRANILYELKRYAEALHAYDQAIAIRPDEAYYYICKGDILKALKREEEAMQIYARAVEIDPRESWSRTHKSFIRQDES
jgi:serine/threonine protein kinase/Tfp pilus assembly protein PilF